MSRVAALALASVLAGCATYRPVPEGFTGPTAVLADMVVPDGCCRATLFAATEVDGNKIANAITATRGASYGTGFMIRARDAERLVPIATMKVRIVGTHATGAPIHELFARAAGNFESVEGVVEFTPKPGQRYAVWGDLDPKGPPYVQIVEQPSGTPVTPKISSR